MTNFFEQMERLNFEHEKEAHKEIERIEFAAKKIAERYCEYESLRSFVGYIASIEKVFARARIYGSSRISIKRDLIKIETRLYGLDSRVDEDVLKNIVDDFSAMYLTITQIYSITERLLQKFSEHPECKNFIESLRDISLAFIEIQEKHFTIDQIEESIYKLKIKTLSASGNPSSEQLEEVYREFKKEITMRQP
jgi:hypothetical protein